MRRALLALVLLGCSRSDAKPPAPLPAPSAVAIVDAGPPLIPGTFVVGALDFRPFPPYAIGSDKVRAELEKTKRYKVVPNVQSSNFAAAHYDCDGGLSCPEVGEAANNIGATDVIEGDIVMIEIPITGRAAKKKQPSIAAIRALDDKEHYAIVVTNLRAVHIADGTVRAATTVTAITPSADTSMDWSVMEPSLQHIIERSHSGFSDALRSMLRDGVAQLTAQLSP